MFKSLLSLTVLLLPIFANALSHRAANPHSNGLAKRAGGDVELFRRFDNSRWSWYDTETGNAGSCGRRISNSEYVVAMNAAQMNSGWCFRRIRMTYNGIVRTATIGDTCPGCPYGGLDLSRGLFASFTSLGAGIIHGSWDFEGAGAAAPPPPAPAPPRPTTTRRRPTPTPPPLPLPTRATTTRRPPPPPPTTRPTPTTTRSSTTSRAQPTTTTRSSSTTRQPSATPTSSDAPTFNANVGPASGLAIPTGTIDRQPGDTENIADLYQAFIGMGAAAAAAANE